MPQILSLVFVTAVLAVPAVCGGQSAAKPNQLTLAVRVENAAVVPAKVLREAEAEASRILAGAGIALRWAECAGEEGNCERDRGTSNVKLVLTSGVPALAVQLSGDAYGAAVHSEGAHPEMAIILWDRVLATDIRRFFLSRGALLGQLIAHELGHLLLGPGAHSRSGIMTAHWSGETLKAAGKGSLAFPHEQRDQMRARLRTMNPPAGVEDATLRH
jgi:hypothetical protein